MALRQTSGGRQLKLRQRPRGGQTPASDPATFDDGAELPGTCRCGVEEVAGSIAAPRSLRAQADLLPELDYKPSACGTRRQQICLYGFREAIEMFAVLCLFHKIFMESETFD